MGGLAALVALAVPSRAADEFQVNSYPWGSQVRPALAILPGGGFVIAWQGTSAIDPRGIGARVFAPDGTGGSELLVNETITGVQQMPDVAADASGRFLVTWEADLDGSGSAVVARRFDADGRAFGGEFVVNTHTAGYQGGAAVASHGDGSFVVVWASEKRPADLDVVAQRFAANGTPLGREIEVAGSSQHLESRAAVTATRDGGFAVAWTSAPAPGGSGEDGDGEGVFVRRFTAGGRPRGTALQVNTRTLGSQAFPAIAEGPRNELLVTWRSEGSDGDETGISAQLLTSNLTPLGPERQLNQLTRGAQQQPQLTRRGDGYVVVWESTEADRDGLGVAGRYLTDEAIPDGPEFRVNQHTARSQYRGDVAALDEDRFVVAWASSEQDGSGFGVFGRVVDGGCLDSTAALCLDRSRFQVTVSWETPKGLRGQGSTVPITGNTGMFWFFDDRNIELVVKVLDGCGVNGRHWVFAGGLTSVATHLMVTDTVTGVSRDYFNPARTPFQPLQDTDAFPCTAESTDELASQLAGDPTTSDSGAARSADESPESSAASPPAAAASAGEIANACLGTGGGLCFHERFAVSAVWRLANGVSGSARPVHLGGDTGYFWFFDETNAELVVKVLDGCGVNGQFWVFAGGLTNLEVDLEVRDNVTGVSRRYRNQPKTAFAPIQDTIAFPCNAPLGDASGPAASSRGE